MSAKSISGSRPINSGCMKSELSKATEGRQREGTSLGEEVDTSKCSIILTEVTVRVVWEANCLQRTEEIVGGIHLVVATSELWR